MLNGRWITLESGIDYLPMISGLHWLCVFSTYKTVHNINYETFMLQFYTLINQQICFYNFNQGKTICCVQTCINYPPLENTLFCTVKPRLSGMHFSGNTAIRTVFLGNERTQRNFAPFSRKSVFPEPDSSLGNQTMFYNDQRSVLSGHVPECHWLQG